MFERHDVKWTKRKEEESGELYSPEKEERREFGLSGRNGRRRRAKFNE